MTTPTPPEVSIIIPAYQAAATLAETLDSVLAQQYSKWEAVIVDDGSTDSTGAIATRYAARDHRIRVIHQPNGGASAARNAGLRAAQGEWLFFLDADDWVMPTQLARLVAVAQSAPQLGVAYGGWEWVATTGACIDFSNVGPVPDAFEVFARTCCFTVHGCIVRRSLVEQVGGFDPSLKTCEDWDLWQRVARTGAQFRFVPDAVARYRMRPGSLSVQARQMLQDGLRVIAQGHAPDPRVPNPDPRYAAGRSPEDLSHLRLQMMGWSAGLILGGGGDARTLLDLVAEDRCPNLDVEGVAESLFRAVLQPTARPPAAWIDVWLEIEERLQLFLEALERHALAPGLRQRVLRHLEDYILQQQSPSRLPFTLGQTHAIRLEATRPIRDILPPAEVQRLLCEVELEGKRLGLVELPVCDGWVAARVLADAVAAKFAWPILGRWFECTLASQIQVSETPAGWSARRGDELLATELPSEVASNWAVLHDQIGWVLFLQELWGQPHWTAEEFYRPGTDQPSVPHKRLKTGRVTLELSEPLPSVMTTVDVLEVIPTVGGVPLGLVRVSAGHGGRVGWRELLAAITTATGMELCRAAVREACLGRPLHDQPAALRTRLQRTARARRWIFRSPSTPAKGAAVIEHRLPEAVDSPLARWAQLPTDSVAVLKELSTTAGEAMHPAKGVADPRAVLYIPALVRPPTNGDPVRAAQGPTAPHAGQDDVPSPEASRTSTLPILMYHRVAPGGPSAMSRYRLMPEAFEEQLRYLASHGFRGITLEAWGHAMRSRRPLSGRAVLITFDDGYQDFLTHAWPLLKRYGFTATVFLVAGVIGGTSRWDRAYGEDIPLLDWDEIRQLQAEGTMFGSHTVSHQALSGLSPTEIVQEIARSRTILEQGLQQPVRAIAYPYGASDGIVEHLAGACGYLYGVTCQHRLAEWTDSPLALPRFEVTDRDTLKDFVKKVNGQPAECSATAS